MEAAIKIIVFVVVYSLILLLFAFPTMWLWNWLMPDVFGLPAVNAKQAFGLLILSSTFFKSTSFSSKG